MKVRITTMVEEEVMDRLDEAIRTQSKLDGKRYKLSALLRVIITQYLAGLAAGSTGRDELCNDN